MNKDKKKPTTKKLIKKQPIKVEHVYIANDTDIELQQHNNRSDLIYVELRLLGVWNNPVIANNNICICTVNSTLYTLLQHIKQTHHVVHNIQLYDNNSIHAKPLKDMNTLIIDLLKYNNKSIQNNNNTDEQENTNNNTNSNNRLVVYYDYTAIEHCPILTKQPTAVTQNNTVQQHV